MTPTATIIRGPHLLGLTDEEHARLVADTQALVEGP